MIIGSTTRTRTRGSTASGSTATWTALSSPPPTRQASGASACTSSAPSAADRSRARPRYRRTRTAWCASCRTGASSRTSREPTRRGSRPRTPGPGLARRGGGGHSGSCRITASIPSGAMRGGSSRALPTRSATGCSPAPPCGASRPDGGEAGPPRALSQLRRVAERTKVLLVVFAYQLTRSPVVVHLEQRPPAARSDAPANDREQLVPFRPKAHASPLLRIGSACMDVESPETLELEGEMRPQPLPVLRDTLGAPEKAHEHPVRLVRDELPLRSKVHHMLPARAGECAAELLEREIDRARAPASEPEVVVGGREARVWVADEGDAEEFG